MLNFKKYDNMINGQNCLSIPRIKHNKLNLGLVKVYKQLAQFKLFYWIG